MKKPPKPDTDQNFWHLACITGSALGLPATIIGGTLAKEYGAGTALISIFVGNLILWLIGLGIISSVHGRVNAIENIRVHLGKKIGYTAALVLAITFLGWYSVQIKETSSAITYLFPYTQEWEMGSLLGLLVAILSIGGIQLIKRFCVFSLPILLCFMIFALLSSEHLTQFQGTWGFSFPATLIIMSMWLPGIVNLPTIFRRSRSRVDSVLGLSLMMVFHIFFQLDMILIGVSDTSGILFNNNTSYLALTLIFILISFTSINLVNICFAHAAWEYVFPKYRNHLGYVVLGLLGTAVYIFIKSFSTYLQIAYPMDYIETIAASFVANLGFILLVDFLIKVVITHRIRRHAKQLSGLSWLVGCISTAVAQLYTPIGSSNPLTLGLGPSVPSNSFTIGIGASLLFFLVVLFIEESIWSYRHLRQSHM